ncbi:MULTISPECIES: hypothetical protein [Marinobacter]|uniref:PA4575 family protein n=1 Tax=Marinobacter TaxID=2742 RepID=UPI002003271F|nr:hypothetical protein [Marinobacter sp. M-5]MCK7550550.1 hypothetical protein [Marinobacter goseongensis]MDV3502234.1 hypothetical protein [Marinobacter sp. M-5]
MKLHYFHGRSPLRALVLVREERRVELYVKQVGADIWALVALSGTDAGQPEKQRCQGPYRSVGRAEAVLRAIAGALLEDDYDPRPADHVVWSVSAQRLARNLRTDTAAIDSRYLFDPDQYEPID